MNELLGGSFVFFALLAIVFLYVNTNVSKNDRSTFWLAFGTKVFGAIFIYLIYFFYYGGGDTISYFERAIRLNSLITESFGTWLTLVFSKPEINNIEVYSTWVYLGGDKTSNFMVVRFAAFFGVLSFNSYVGSALLLSFFTLMMQWRLYQVLKTAYNMINPFHLAIAVLFVPSAVFWSSGLLKDSITFGFTCLFVSSFFLIIEKREKVLLNVLLILISGIIIAKTKSYIILAAFPALAIWFFLKLNLSIKSRALQKFSMPIFILLMLGASLILLNTLGSSFERFNVENAMEKAEDMQRWHTYRVEVLKGGDGASYSLGDTKFTTTGLLQKIPAAIIVTLFRPFLWEVSSPVVLITAIESLMFLYFSYFMVIKLFKSRFMGPKLNIPHYPFFVFCFVFSMIFAFSVGITSYNFGALARYKIPLLPFYTLMIVIVKNSNVQST